jgi:predicted nucleic acid-binding protein
LPTLTYLDASVLIAAIEGEGPAAARAYEVINDPNRAFVFSDYVRLETICKPTFQRRRESLDIYEEFFRAAVLTPNTDELVRRAIELGCKHDIAPLDALHVSASISAKSGEFVTGEASTKPLFRAVGLGVKLTSIYSA